VKWPGEIDGLSPLKLSANCVLQGEQAPAISLSRERRVRDLSPTVREWDLEIFRQILEEESRVGVGKAYLPHKNYP
jgi:hypothetical protein